MKKSATKKPKMMAGGTIPNENIPRTKEVIKYEDGSKTVEKYKKRNGKIKSSDELRGPGRYKTKTVYKLDESTGEGSKKNILVKDGKRTVEKYNFNFKTGGAVKPTMMKKVVLRKNNG